MKALALAAVVKWGELFFPYPFESDPDKLSLTAFLMITVPTAANVAKW